MKRKNAARSALFTSIISLLLCVSMLVGTTFAWFTDEVKSGVNTIAAGNLDVELYHGKNANPADKVNEGTLLFTDESGKVIEHWEPGVVAFTNLKVANVGTLALRYQLSINSTEQNYFVDGDGVQHTLSEALKVAVVKGGVSGNRAAVVAEGAKNGWSALKSFTLPGVLEADKTSETYGIVIYWEPGNNAYDNMFNMNNGKSTSDKNPLSITLGVNLFATQEMYEDDSFGPDYDIDAWHTEMEVQTASDLQAAVNNADSGTKIVLMDDVKLDEPLVIPALDASTYSLRSAPVGIGLDLNGKTITTAYDATTEKHQYAIDNYGSLVIYGGTIEARGIYNQDGANLTVNGTKIVNLDTNGGSSIWSYGGNVVLNNAELIGYSGCVYSKGNLEINGGTYTCYSSVLDDGTQINPTYNIRSYGDLVINSGNFTSRHGLVAVVDGNAVINGGTYTMNSIGVITSHVFYIAGDNSNVTVNNGTFNCDLRTAQANGSSMICVDAENVTVNVKGGSYNLTPASYVADGYEAKKVGEGWMVLPENENYVANGVTTDGDTYFISNRAGFAWMDEQEDNFFGNKTIKLTADIDFGGETLTGVKFWNAHPTFDGQGHTLSNYVVAHSGSKTPSGLFRGTFNVQNLVIDNANVTGDYAGAIAGNMYGNVTNCVVKNSTITSTYWQGGGLVGQYNNGNVTGCTVENCTISGGSAVGGLIGILNETAGTRKVENCAVKNCDIIMDGGFGGDYDNYFGAAVGLINVENSEIYFSCDVTDTTVKGAASDALYGEDGGNIVYIDGIRWMDKPTVVAPAPAGENNVFPATANVVTYKNVKLVGEAQIVHTENCGLALSGVIAELDHDVIIRKSGGAICVENSEFTLTNGAKLISVGEGGDAYQVFLVNVKVNGELLTQENAGQYLEGISWFQAVPEWPEMA